MEEIAETLGIDKVKLSNSLSTNRFSDDIENDIYQSKQIGVHGVPFFLMNYEISVRGAQEEQIFLESIKKAWVNWNRNLKMIPTIVKGDICSEDSCS